MSRIGKSIDPESRLLFARDWGKRVEWEVTAKGHRVSFESDENDLELDSGDGYKILWIIYFNGVNFILCELYLNNNQRNLGGKGLYIVCYLL